MLGLAGQSCRGFWQTVQSRGCRLSSPSPDAASTTADRHRARQPAASAIPERRHLPSPLRWHPSPLSAERTRSVPARPPFSGVCPHGGRLHYNCFGLLVSPLSTLSGHLDDQCSIYTALYTGVRKTKDKVHSTQYSVRGTSTSSIGTALHCTGLLQSPQILQFNEHLCSRFVVSSIRASRRNAPHSTATVDLSRTVSLCLHSRVPDLRIRTPHIRYASCD